MKYSNQELWQFIKQHPDFTNFTGKDHDLRDWTKVNPEISVNLEKGSWYNHKTGEGGGLYDLARVLNVLPETKKNIPTANEIWQKSKVVTYDLELYKLAKSYFTDHRKIPTENYSDLLKNDLIRVNKYKGDQMLIYPSLTPETARLAMENKPYEVNRIQRIFVKPDGSSHLKGKQHYGSNGNGSAAFVIPPMKQKYSKNHAVVFEGLEDALSVRSEYPDSTILVATDKAGLKHVQGFFNSGRLQECLIIADHDTDENPEATGQALSWQLGQKLEKMGIHVSVKMPAKPKEDANSALQSGQLETWLKSLIDIPEKYQKTEEAFKTEEWQSPIPLVREQEEPQPYPVEDLGQIIGEAVEEFQYYGKQPISMVASTALATASLCCQGLADVSRDSQNRSPISLYFLSISESGERKSSTDKAFSKSLRDWQSYKAIEIKDEVRRSIAQHSAWESERSGLLKAIQEAKKSSKLLNGKSLDNLKDELENHELDEPEILYPPRLFFEDTNAEALAYFAAKGYPSFSLWSDEAGLTIGSHGMR